MSDPNNWGLIAFELEQKKWYDQQDIDMGWEPGTSATRAGKPHLAPAVVDPLLIGAGQDPAWYQPPRPTGSASAIAPTPADALPRGINGPATATAPAVAMPTGLSPDRDAWLNTPPGTAAPIGPAPFDRMGFDQLARFLQDAGLDTLFSLTPNGLPSGWLWDRIVDGTVDNQDSLYIAIENTDQFKQRYVAIGEARRLKQSYIPTMKDVREYETNVARMLRNAGLPSSFYDDPIQDLQSLMIKGLSAVEIEQRLGKSWEMVRNTDPLVRSAFEEFFGVGNGDGVLAAMWLDPGYTESKLDQMARTAYTGGMGRSMGIDVDKAMAERIAMLPKTEGGILQDFAQVNAMGGVFTETITEGDDLTAEDTGLGAVALGDASDMSAIQKRLAERGVNNRATSGGAAVTQAGVVGLSQ